MFILAICLAAKSAPPSPPGPRFDPAKILPDDTLGFVTAQDWPHLRTVLQGTAYGRLWQDPLLAPFRESFQEKFAQSILQPIERELDVHFKDYKDLLAGTLTLAATRDGWNGKTADRPGWVLLIDADHRTNQLSKRLAELRNRWFLSGKPFRTQRIAGTEFTMLELSPNSAICRLSRFLPRPLEYHELGRSEAPANSEPPRLFFGMIGKVLAISTSSKPLEKLVVRSSESAAPALDGQSAYDVCQRSLFRDAPVYAWLNTGAFFEAYGAAPERKGDAPPGPVDALDSERLVKSTGLGELRSAGIVFQASRDGLLIDLLLHAPESQRRGLLKLLAGDAGDVSILPSVPADAVRFQRWRINGGNAWATFQDMMSELSPQWTSTINFIIDTANQAAQLKDPSFDVRKNLLLNLGNDMITYSKAPPAGSTNDGPSILLIQSPHPEQMAAALQRVLIFLSADAENPQQREFLGRRIYSVPLPAVPLPFEAPGPVDVERTLHYSATSSYVALSTDVVMLEEFLRAPESNTKALCDLPSVKQPASALIEPSTSLFLFENQTELVRPRYEALRMGRSSTNAPPLLAIPLSGARQESSILDLFNFTLLPPYERVARHFNVLVRASSARTDGIRVKWFYPERPKRP